MSTIITIDGPAASGKSSVSRELAKRLNFKWVSTGAFYRGLAYACIQSGLSLESEAKIVDLCKSNRWSVEMFPEGTKVFFENQEVTKEIANEEIGFAASIISRIPSVRDGLLQAQRNCALKTNGLIAEGRDCGTVVFPVATAKVFLTARSESRAERRAKELGVSALETSEKQSQRDQSDANRKVAPLLVPEGALVVDTSELNFLEVVEKVESFVRTKI